MRLIINLDDVPLEQSPGRAARWTAIVPAAGRGSRLRASEPKVIYPVLGKPILVWLAQLLKPLCAEIVLVASPEGLPQIDPVLKSAWGTPVQPVIQDHPTGMGDAVALCEERVKTSYALVIWGDQITLRSRTLEACMTIQESSPAIQATIPTIFRNNPYIHLIRDPQERLIEVYHAREAEEKLGYGENDCGVFCFRTEALFRVLRETRGDPAYRGLKTQENNFLSLLPLFHNDRGSLVTVRIQDPEETLGINTPAEAGQAGEILKRRGS